MPPLHSMVDAPLDWTPAAIGMGLSCDAFNFGAPMTQEEIAADLAAGGEKHLVTKKFPPEEKQTFFGLWEVYPAARTITFTMRVYKDLCLHNPHKYHLQPLDGTTVQGLVSDRSFHRVFHADDDEISQERMPSLTHVALCAVEKRTSWSPARVSRPPRPSSRVVSGARDPADADVF